MKYTESTLNQIPTWELKEIVYELDPDASIDSDWDRYDLITLILSLQSERK